MTSSYSKYDTPQSVLLDTGISKTEKIEILKTWVEDENALLRASAEGLDGGERPHLKQAQLALESLTDNGA